MKLFPKESVDDFYDTLIAVLWVLGILAFGTLIIWLVGLLINVSVQSPFGIGGAAAVVLLAFGVGVAVFWGRRRKRDRIVDQQGERSTQPNGRDGTVPLVRRISRPTRPAPPEVKETFDRPVYGLNPHIADELFQLKRQVASAMETANYDKVEQILLRIEEVDDQRDWCLIQREAVQLKLRRKV